MLADGTAVLLRMVRRTDGRLLQAALRELSDRTRYLRFHAPRTAFSEEELRYLTDVDGEKHFALAALDARAKRLVGVGRFFRVNAAATEAELALAVVDALQGRGLGSLLLDRLSIAAREREVRRFTGFVLGENTAMRQLVRKAGGRVGLPCRGVCEIELALQ